MSHWYHKKPKSGASISQAVFALIVFLLFGLYLTYGKSFLIFLVLGTLVIFGLVLIFYHRKHTEVTIGQTKYSRLLWAALKERGVESITEYSDGYKKVDLAVLPAKLYIEVDGLQHSLKTGQVIDDLKRDNYSDKDGFRTMRIPNQAIKDDLNTVADTLAQIIKSRQ
jgi:very-short-patch-repair endonuclease